MIKKRETSVQNITFIAIICAIIGVISIMSAFIPFFGIIISLIVPLASVLVILFCKPSYYIVFIFTAIGLCLSVTLYNIENTIFYIIPGLITGMIFGLCLKNGLNHGLSILLVSIIQAALNVGAHLLIYYVYEINIIKSLLELFNLTSKEFINTIIPLTFLLFSLMQFILTFLIIYPQLAVFFKEKTKPHITNIVLLVTALLSFIIATCVVFISPATSYLFMGIGLYCSILISYVIIKTKSTVWIIYVCVSVAIGIGIFIGLNQQVAKPCSLLLLNSVNLLLPLPLLIKHQSFLKNLTPLQY